MDKDTPVLDYKLHTFLACLACLGRHTTRHIKGIVHDTQIFIMKTRGPSNVYTFSIIDPKLVILEPVFYITKQTALRYPEGIKTIG